MDKFPDQQKTIENAICFFAYEHHKKTKRYLTQTYLYKYLGLLEFNSIKETGKPVLGLTFVAMENGPVPIEIYSERDHIESDCFRFVRLSNDSYQVIPNGKPNLDYFSEFEIQQMKQLIMIYANKFVSLSDIIESSHKEIKAWQKAWDTKPNSKMEYEMTFDDDLYSKSDSELSFAEECFLTYQAIQKSAM